MVAAGSGVNGKTAIHSIFHMYFGSLEAFGQAFDPYMKGIARSQLELMGLASRRTQAILEVPSRLSRCRTPQDLLNEQVQYWRTAYEDYSDSMERVGEALASCLAPSFSFGLPPDEADSAHDYISFPETREHREPARHGPRRRKAA